jgi:hypothetical protein
METALGCGYSINDESALTDFYSPPSSIANEEEDLFYPEEEEEEEDEEEEIHEIDLSKFNRNFSIEKNCFFLSSSSF